MHATLATDALNMAFTARGGANGVLVHHALRKPVRKPRLR